MLDTSRRSSAGLRSSLGEPRPLRLAQHGLGRIGIGQVALLARRAALVGELERRAEPAHVEQDDLHAHAGRADDVRIVDALARAPHVARRHLPEVEEEILRHRLVGKVAAAVVQAVVVVVPDREMAHAVAQLVVARDGIGRGVGLAQGAGVGGVEIAIDVVAGEDEKLGLVGENGVPDRLRIGLLGARAEGDARQRAAGLGGEAGGQQRGRGHELGKSAAEEHGSGHPNARIAALVVTTVKRHLKYALELLFVPIAAAIVFIEETLLHYLGLAMAAIAKWPPVARLEAWLRGLPPWGALLAFVAPSLLVIPIKLSAVWFALHHRYGLSLRQCCHWQDAGDGPGGAPLSGPAADAGEDAVVPAAPRPGCSTGATGSTPSCAPCRPGSGPRRWSSACGVWMREMVFRASSR